MLPTLGAGGAVFVVPVPGGFAAAPVEALGAAAGAGAFATATGGDPAAGAGVPAGAAEAGSTTDPS